MRAMIVGLILLALPPPALAGDPLPEFRKHAPYPTVRAQLIRLGFAPVPVRAKPGDLAPCPYPTPFCRTYPEIVRCSQGAHYCHFLFRRPSDGRLLIVQTGGEPNDSVTPPDFSTVSYLSRFEPQASDLADVVIASDAHMDRR